MQERSPSCFKVIPQHLYNHLKWFVIKGRLIDFDPVTDSVKIADMEVRAIGKRIVYIVKSVTMDRDTTEWLKVPRKQLETEAEISITDV